VRPLHGEYAPGEPFWSGGSLREEIFYLPPKLRIASAGLVQITISVGCRQVLDLTEDVNNLLPSFRRCVWNFSIHIDPEAGHPASGDVAKFPPVCRSRQVQQRPVA